VDRLRPGPDGLDTLDGAFAAAWWDGERRRLTLVRDPFGVRSLYHVEHGGAFYFASELKQLLAIPGLPVEAHPVALHEYLTLSFVPGEDVPLSGVRRVLPGRLAEWDGRRLAVTPYFTRPPHPAEGGCAERALRRAAPRPAVRPSGRGAGVRDPAPAQAPRPVEKYLLKEAVRDLLPPAILERPKSGMLVPVEGWLAPRGGPLHAHARERLLDGLTGWGLLRRPWLERLLAGRLGGLRPRPGAKIWLLVTLEAWLRTVLGSP
jgi:asparagine synthetase B (glutamine-hydrolysing)